MTCHNGRPGPDHESKDCYHWFTVNCNTTYVTPARKWVVIMGLCSHTQMTASGILTVSKGAANDTTTTIDDVDYGGIITGFTAGTPTNVSAAWTGGTNLISMAQLTRRMLVPPGYTITVTNQCQLSLVQCDTLDHALDIL